MSPFAISTMQYRESSSYAASVYAPSPPGVHAFALGAGGEVDVDGALEPLEQDGSAPAAASATTVAGREKAGGFNGLRRRRRAA